jgi:hypothetical protein
MMEPLPQGFEEAIEAAQAPRRLRRVFNLRWGLPPIGRYRRYVVSIAPALGAVWGLTALYLVAAPVKYESQFTMILPGSGAGSSMNLESIGQAQNTSSSAFSSPTLSPTEGYKQLLSADVTLREAARMAHLPETKFPAPKVKLIVQTNLIEVAVTGRTPQQARANGEALIAAFQAELDHLRGDEAARREEQDRKHLAELAAKERAAEARLIEFQARHGLATLEQFNARIASVDGLRDKERDLRIALRQHQGERAAGAKPGRTRNWPIAAGACAAIRCFRNWCSAMPYPTPMRRKRPARWARAIARWRKTMPSGPNCWPRLCAGACHHRDQRCGRDARGGPDAGRWPFRPVANHGHGRRAGGGHGARAGRIARRHCQCPGAQARADRHAQQLADLQRDQRIAAAVFSSALARLDTNKLDPFASYPLVQTLAAPTLPGKKSSPSAIIALAGAFGASFSFLSGLS